jgi:hypothetical protein
MWWGFRVQIVKMDLQLHIQKLLLRLQQAWAEEGRVNEVGQAKSWWSRVMMMMAIVMVMMMVMTMTYPVPAPQAYTVPVVVQASA